MFLYVYVCMYAYVLRGMFVCRCARNYVLGCFFILKN